MIKKIKNFFFKEYEYYLDKKSYSELMLLKEELKFELDNENESNKSFISTFKFVSILLFIVCLIGFALFSTSAIIQSINNPYIIDQILNNIYSINPTSSLLFTIFIMLFFISILELSLFVRKSKMLQLIKKINIKIRSIEKIIIFLNNSKNVKLTDTNLLKLIPYKELLIFKENTKIIE